MELSLGQGDFVLDGDHAPPPQKGTGPPNFRSMFMAAKRMKLVLGMEVGLSPDYFGLDGDPAPPSQKVGEAPPNFPPMFTAAKRLDE